MSNIQNETTSFLQSLSLTGNAYLDTFILSSAVPIVIAYIQSILGLFKSFAQTIFYLVMNWIKYKVKDKLVGYQQVKHF